ncbi:hypothetical protein ACE1MK_00815 [Tenacibaculum maritimum]|uniref:Lipoprotein n=1 Tax=Tenacibaculum maritimum NCIMB 2154 TaxID=1349785 RepID=A0A2H1ED17_9FLAO|nr:hypothetical protein [Tenacibaculum maritimum]CAA0220122.1 conserved hypothetical protein [Tenacibaculum maritimum]CAA0230713.1 conserved hypothetical protein [Tenacibaculum maritimum]SFZ84816.1 conserved protein of unknown function [Tenacibaculum maritimum NCIMB 2154]
MTYTKFILVLVFAIFSCRNSNTDKKRSNRIVEQKKEEEKNIQTGNKFYQPPAYFNPTTKLGLGLLKPKKDTILFKQQVNHPSLKETIYTPKKVIPIFFKPDYDIFYIVCIKNTDLDYKILSANGKEFLANKANFDFIPWENFLLKTTGIENINWKENPLRKESKVTSLEVFPKHKENFIIKQVKNNWIKVKNEEDEEGWIKWKEKEKFLIEIYLLM